MQDEAVSVYHERAWENLIAGPLPEKRDSQGFFSRGRFFFPPTSRESEARLTSLRVLHAAVDS